MSVTASRYAPALWSLDSYAAMETMRQLYQSGPRRITRYSVKHLRYWFIRHLLERQADRLGRPIKVLEVGVDRGQMLAYMNHGRARHPHIDRWDAIDVAPQAL